MLATGQTAPLFTAESTHGTIRLADYIGKQPIVLIFYPMDDTPGCTAQLCAVRDSKALYARHNALVFGVNQGGLDSHHKFAKKHGYDFPIISDSDNEIRKAYDVGRMLGLFLQQRIVYVIGLDGRIAFARKGTPSTEDIVASIKPET
ncbi:peroxiredoxin [Paenibacillus koleovorans]|uniref:peroxiredoxin n=1 Tax=Paenibacillus koleovorans TaxID=121608 RepID=UPI000FD8032A|nr:peroxiredoxin [Paenibacillus koleovorans]